MKNTEKKNKILHEKVNSVKDLLVGYNALCNLACSYTNIEDEYNYLSNLVLLINEATKYENL